MKISAFSITFLAFLFHTNGLKVLRKRSPSALGGDKELSKIFEGSSTSSYNSASMGGNDKWKPLSHDTSLPVESTVRDFKIKVTLEQGENYRQKTFAFKNGSSFQNVKVNIRYFYEDKYHYKSKYIPSYQKGRIDIPSSSEDVYGYAETE